MPVFDDEQIYKMGLQEYNERYKLNLELTNLNDFFVYDPISRDHAVSKTLIGGIQEMAKKHPDSTFFTIQRGSEGVFQKRW